jgi:hypothetical protein
MNEALKHTLACQRLVERDEIDCARAYCAAQGVVPPPAVAGDAHPNGAALCDYGWWVKRLKLRRARKGRAGGRRGAAG